MNIIPEIASLESGLAISGIMFTSALDYKYDVFNCLHIGVIP